MISDTDPTTPFPTLDSHPTSEKPLEKPSVTHVPTPAEMMFISEVMALSAKGIAIKKGAISVRAFHLTGYSGAILAVLLQESDDGYLVALPAQLMHNEAGVVTINFVTATPIVKIHKQTVPIFSFPTQRAFYHYLAALAPKYSVMKGFFNEERIIQIDSLLSQMEEVMTDLKKRKPEKVDLEEFQGESLPTSEEISTKAKDILQKEGKGDKIKPSKNAFFIEHKNAKYLH